jgi:hypothetical protein
MFRKSWGVAFTVTKVQKSCKHLFYVFLLFPSFSYILVTRLNTSKHYVNRKRTSGVQKPGYNNTKRKYLRRIEIYNQLNAQFFIYSIIILYHDPLHVSSITCSSSGGHCIFAVSDILTLCMMPYVEPIKSGLQSALNRCTVWQHTEREDTRYCKYTMSS